MGAWGSGSFENDDAMDWVSDLSASPDWSTVQAALDQVLALGPDDYLEAPDASVALAAAEVVAAAMEAPASNLPAEVTDWTAIHGANVEPDHAKGAYRAVMRVVEQSELQELWEETGDPSGWQGAVVDLQKRLAGAHRTDDL